MFGTSEPRPLPLNLPATLSDTIVGAIAIAESDVAPFLGPANRFTAPDRIDDIERYLLQSFAAAGWQAVREPIPDSESNFTSANIVALKPGDRSELIVVGAHYDTVDESPGADDNAAGAAALIALAKALGPLRFQRSIALLAFDLEEIGFGGSLSFVAAHRDSIHAALILECIAYTDARSHSQRVPPRLGLLYPQQVARLRARAYRGDTLLVLYNRRSVGHASLLAGAAEALASRPGSRSLSTIALRDPTDLPLVGPILRRYFPAARHFARSDHLPFWHAGLSALQLTDTADFRNPHYHRASDTPDTLDYSFLTEVARATALTVAQLAVPEQS